MESVLRIAADHPAYAGHFPGRPILPGVALLSEVMHEIARATDVLAHLITAWSGPKGVAWGS
jgi:3-hydroxymyristoyl/3-hydroxydecanoyl-(acyl carrier protein) dehydratase